MSQLHWEVRVQPRPGLLDPEALLDAWFGAIPPIMDATQTAGA